MTTFDARTAKQLPAGEHLTFIDYAGLRLSASTKSKNWVYRYKSPVDGRMRQISIGKWPAISFHAAVVAWENLKKERDAGGDPALKLKEGKQQKKATIIEAEKAKKELDYTVRNLCDDFLDGYVDINRARKGAVEARRMFEKMLGEIENVPVKLVTRSMAFDLIQSHINKSPVQAGRLRCELGAAWDYALDAGRLPETAVNWWRLILKGKIKSKGKMISGERIGTAKRVLTEQEIGELIRWFPNFSPIIYDSLIMYLWTATRGAEIVAIKGSEIEYEGNQLWWTIPKKKTKNARHSKAGDHRVPLFGRAKLIIERRKEIYQDGYLFQSKFKTSQHIDQATIQTQVFYRQPYSVTRPDFIRARLPVSHWAPHDLRRSSRTLLAKLGCPDSVAESILGHMLPGIVGTYNLHQYDEEKVKWLSILSDHLEALATT
jgi:integrase